MAAIIKDLAQVNADLQEEKERLSNSNIDFKMVTFSLAGKDYGVDIMNVKEIAKADKFTYVPNAASFVRGVYNLRGDIIPVIDLRTFFHLPIIDKSADNMENMLILHINDQVYGTIVDKIDKVIGINHETIQPPHPIFGDINIKYISGVVEKEGDLYIILDVIRIFTVSDDDKNKSRGTSVAADSGEFYVPPPSADAQSQAFGAKTEIGFIKESLFALRGFNVTRLNDKWLHKRFHEWSIGRSGDNLQLRTASEADEFLMDFISPDSGAFWSEHYANAVKSVLPDLSTNTINVWNVGCGKGYETYSFACVLKSRYPDKVIKIWANDNDIMAVSQAPNMVYEFEELPEYCRQYMVHGQNGYSFNQAIKNSIVFEYHDINHENALPDLDIILARDVLSYLTESEQVKILDSFSEKLKSRGIIFIGRNENLEGLSWQAMADDPVSAYLHNV